MAIDVVKVLPGVGDVPIGLGRQSQLGERIILEMLQRENAMATQQQRYALDSYKDAVATMSKDAFLSKGVPYLDNLNKQIGEKSLEFAQRLKDASGNSNAINNVMLDYDNYKKTDPTIRNFIQEKILLDNFDDQIRNNATKLDPIAFQGLWEKINDPNRKTPLTAADLNPSSLAYDIDKVADDFIKANTKEISVYKYDQAGNVIRGKRVITKQIPDDIEQKLVNMLSNHPGTEYYGTDIIKEISKRKVDAFKYSNYENGKPIGQESEDRVYDPNPGRESAAKQTYGEKLNQKLHEGGIDGKMVGDVSGSTSTVKFGSDGKPRLFGADESDKGSLVDNWDSLPDEFKSTLKDAGIDYDRYVVGGSGRKFASFDFGNVEMKQSGMAPSDAAYSKQIGAASRSEIKDGYLETNNPEVLDKMGFTLSYDDKLKRYKLTDKSTGKVYDETGSAEENKKRSNTGIFKTSGSTTTKGDYNGTPEVGESVGTEKIFKVKVNSITPSTVESKGVKFEASTDVDENTYKLIGYGESRGARDTGTIAVNASDAGWVSVGHYQFNTKDNQDTVFNAGGKGKEWGVLKEQMNGLTEKERGEKIRALYNSMTADEKKSFNDAEDKIAKEKYFDPLDAQFAKDNISVPNTLKPLIRDMAIQHTTGMLGNKSLYNKIKAVINKGGDPKFMAKEISDIRGVYVSGLNIPPAVKRSVLENRIPDALEMTYKIIDKAGSISPVKEQSMGSSRVVPFGKKTEGVKPKLESK